MQIMNSTSRGGFYGRLRSASCKIAALWGLLAAFAAGPVFADETANVGGLIRAGRYAEALTIADAFLAWNPRDAQMRFLKGVILSEQRRPGEAITIFARLTEDFPGLPEPYNNLAVLYAADGQFDKARAALDTAIRINPGYAAAYENLGDVYARFALQAYAQASQLELGSDSVKSKLARARSLAGNPATNPGASNETQKLVSAVQASAMPASHTAGKKSISPDKKLKTIKAGRTKNNGKQNSRLKK